MHVSEPLNTDTMVKAGKYFVGEHDFTAFSNAKSKKKSMVRSIYSIDLKEEEGMIRIRISGDGFLYNMVRKMVGVLIEAGLGKLDCGEIPDLIEAGDRSRLSLLAEAGGLFLEKVEY
jgi:tRNA pseudouridine38-40 synthase